MAPRPPKMKADDTSSLASTSTVPSPLKPRTSGVKVEKADRTKTGKTKIVRVANEEEKLKAIGDAAGKKVGDKEKEREKDKDLKQKDGKEKVKAVTGDEAIEVMKRYLESQNRPYSATEVSANLHGKVTKTVADKLLKEMEQSGLIKAKATNGDKKGSQWVFWAIQKQEDAATPAELTAMDTQISSLRNSIPALKSTLKLLSTKLTTLKAAPTMSELAATVRNLQKHNEEKRQKLSACEKGAVKMVTTEEVQRMEREWRYWAGKRTARMGAYKGLEALLLEGMSRDEIIEKVGIEPDTYES